jgi:hypothetical protein
VGQWAGSGLAAKDGPFSRQHGREGSPSWGWNEAKIVFDARLQQGAGKGNKRSAYCQLENRFQLRASRSSVRRAWWTSFPGV